MLYHILDYIVYYSISQLTQLHTLHVSGNNLQILPDVLLKMKSLRELYLRFCSLETLPDE